MKKKIGFKTLDNKTGEKTLKQHVFKKYYNHFNNDLMGFVDEPNGNKSLCGKAIACSEDGPISINEMTEQIDNNICQTCFKLMKKYE